MSNSSDYCPSAIEIIVPPGENCHASGSLYAEFHSPNDDGSARLLIRQRAFSVKRGLDGIVIEPLISDTRPASGTQDE